MPPQYPALARHLDDAGVDGYAVDADGEDSTQRYLSGFHALGNVFTVEPGLYEQGTGGVRLEDVVVVTEDGYECLNDYPRDLRVV